MKKFMHFCNMYSATVHFRCPNSCCVILLHTWCRASSYLSAIRHRQIVQKLPEPRQSSTLPHLKLVQMGVQRDRANRALPPTRCRLLITLPILRRLRDVWLPSATTAGPNSDVLLMWAASALCIFGIFRVGELTYPSAGAFDPAVHLAWRDVGVDDTWVPVFVRVLLTQSKCDQIGEGVYVFIGHTENSPCPVAAVLLCGGPGPEPW